MNNNIITEIEKSRVPCYFISPHLDDAMLSAGGLITYLAKKTDVTLISIFTEASPKPYTRAAKGFLRYCGYKDAKRLFEIRKKEDINACAMAGVKAVHLGFIDGTFRKRHKPFYFSQLLSKQVPELIHLYPLGFKVLKLAEQDKQLALDVQKRFLEVIPQNKKVAIFCPLGTVKHMDHILTRNICVSTFDNLIFWTDYPYISLKKANETLKHKNLSQLFTWESELEKKKQIIAQYKTQLSSLFPHGSIPLIPEVYSASRIFSL